MKEGDTGRFFCGPRSQTLATSLILEHTNDHVVKSSFHCINGRMKMLSKNRHLPFLIFATQRGQEKNRDVIKTASKVNEIVWRSSNNEK